MTRRRRSASALARELAAEQEAALAVQAQLIEEAVVEATEQIVKKSSWIGWIVNGVKSAISWMKSRKCSDEAAETGEQPVKKASWISRVVQAGSNMQKGFNRSFMVQIMWVFGVGMVLMYLLHVISFLYAGMEPSLAFTAVVLTYAIVSMRAAYLAGSKKIDEDAADASEQSAKKGVWISRILAVAVIPPLFLWSLIRRIRLPRISGLFRIPAKFLGYLKFSKLPAFDDIPTTAILITSLIGMIVMVFCVSYTILFVDPLVGMVFAGVAFGNLALMNYMGHKKCQDDTPSKPSEE